eukprot:TRINITY_DN16333_c0_g1_i1.p3 TRINITY_DN16333_c0_g1~~TRINITY_DN16333_c0_g1_i1.p3  ORF type:complete len:78 (+),score=15.41 TRINITY_DN16333_c0_g1_i1:211-444(+)
MQSLDPTTSRDETSLLDLLDAQNSPDHSRDDSVVGIFAYTRRFDPSLWNPSVVMTENFRMVRLTVWGWKEKEKKTKS